MNKNDFEGFVVRQATRSDVPGIVAMLAQDELGQTREVLSDPVHADYYEAFDAINRNPSEFLVVLIDPNGVLSGTLQLSLLQSLSRRGGKRAQIEAVRVSPALRGKGLGKFMFQWAIEQARGLNCQLVQLTSDNSRPAAHAFYESIGFEPSHVGFKLSL